MCNFLSEFPEKNTHRPGQGGGRPTVLTACELFTLQIDCVLMIFIVKAKFAGATSWRNCLGVPLKVEEIKRLSILEGNQLEKHPYGALYTEPSTQHRIV
jgi:hypothetical protein